MLLFIFLRKREEEKKREVLTNPVKMKKIKEMVKLHLFWWIFKISEDVIFDDFTIINKPSHVSTFIINFNFYSA